MTGETFLPVAIRVRDTSEAPRAADIYYGCRLCGGRIPSQPEGNVGCECGNVFIDRDYHRLAVRDLEQFQVLRRGGEDVAQD